MLRGPPFSRDLPRLSGRDGFEDALYGPGLLLCWRGVRLPVGVLDIGREPLGRDGVVGLDGLVFGGGAFGSELVGGGTVILLLLIPWSTLGPVVLVTGWISLHGLTRLADTSSDSVGGRFRDVVTRNCVLTLMDFLGAS